MVVGAWADVSRVTCVLATDSEAFRILVFRGTATG